jgi:hypothetical protein
MPRLKFWYLVPAVLIVVMLALALHQQTADPTSAPAPTTAGSREAGGTTMNDAPTRSSQPAAR